MNSINITALKCRELELERSNASLQGKLDDVLSRFDCARGETVAATNRIRELKKEVTSLQKERDELKELITTKRIKVSQALYQRKCREADTLKSQLASAVREKSFVLKRVADAEAKLADAQEKLECGFDGCKQPAAMCNKHHDKWMNDLAALKEREGELAGLERLREAIAWRGDYEPVLVYIEKRRAELEGKEG